MLLTKVVLFETQIKENTLTMAANITKSHSLTTMASGTNLIHKSNYL